MSDNENGSPMDRSKRPRFSDDEEWDSDYERDGHDDRHPKRLAVPDPETKAPHFVPNEDNNNNSSNHRRKKWEEKDGDSDEEDIKPRISSSSSTTSGSKVANDHQQQQQQQQQKEDNNAESISIRSLVGTKDAGVIIGRGGKNVSDIRELSNARVTISEIVPGAYERILTVSGPVNAVAKAYSLVGEKILSEHTQPEESNSDGEQTLTIKLLVPDNKMGTLIGKGGSVIKSIQDDSHARLNASEEPLPMSTERTISIQGTPLAVQQAIQRIAKILMEHTDRSSTSNIIQYRPIANTSGGGSHRNQNYMRSNNNSQQQQQVAAMYNMMPMNMPTSQFYYHGGPNANNAYGVPNARQNDYGMGMGMGMGMNMGMNMGMTGMATPSQAQQIFIPNEMVGCIIGKGGSKINEIRQLSGSHIKIADSQSDANERLVTITGTPESNQMALYLLYSRLESEKNRMGLRQN